LAWPKIPFFSKREVVTVNKNIKVAGLSPHEPITTNKKGGKQSATLYRFDLIPPSALFDVARIVAQGSEKYGDNNWKKIETESHINHALQHLYAWLEGDESDEHLAHAACRCLFATYMEKQS